MTPPESITRAGKLYLLENDTSTHIATASGNTFAGHESGVTHPQETIQLLRRNLMLTLFRNAGFWWMDLQGAGWFNDSALWKQQEFFRDWMKRNMQHPTPYRPEIGVFLDEKSMCAITGPGMTGCTTPPLIPQGRADWNRIGAPYGQYLLRDLPAVTDGTKLHIVAGGGRFFVMSRFPAKKIPIFFRMLLTFSEGCRIIKLTDCVRFRNFFSANGFM